MWKSLLIITLSLLIISFVFLKLFYYFEPYPWCRIKIESDIIKGNKKTIQEALKFMKAQNYQSWRDLCQYVDVIGEDNCQYSRSGESTTFKTQSNGCYVKGSRNIYISPEKGETGDIIKKRASIIQKYTQASKDFWLKGAD